MSMRVLLIFISSKKTLSCPGRLFLWARRKFIERLTM